MRFGWVSLTIFYNFWEFKETLTTVLKPVIYVDGELGKGYS